MKDVFCGEINKHLTNLVLLIGLLIQNKYIIVIHTSLIVNTNLWLQNYTKLKKTYKKKVLRSILWAKIEL